jgi:hypothetical protein
MDRSGLYCVQLDVPGASHTANRHHVRNSLSPTSCSRDIRARVLVDETLSRSPSFRDWDHYGDSMITLDLLYDMEKFRRERGALFVNWDDVKPLDRRHRNTDRDDIGCYMGPNPFEGGVSSLRRRRQAREKRKKG